MGRMGIGPDLGDETIGSVGSEWRCPRCNYPNSGSQCRDCGYSATHHIHQSPFYSEDGVTTRRQSSTCTCDCPVHGSRKKTKVVKEKPWTKKEKAEHKAAVKRLAEQINKSIHGRRKLVVKTDGTMLRKLTKQKRKKK
jgi:hypothetical protein